MRYSSFFLKDKKISLMLVFLIYMFAMPYVENVLIPGLFFYLVYFSSIYLYIPSFYLFVVMICTELVISYCLCIVLLAGCFNADGLLVARVHRVYKTRSKFINNAKFFYKAFLSYFVFILICLFFLYLEFYIKSESFPKVDFPFETALKNGSFVFFVNFYIEFWPFSLKAIFGGFLVFLFYLLIAYHWLVPHPIIIGIQIHIWKIKPSDIDLIVS